jgi:hypothetical protein
VGLGLCTQIELDALVRKAAAKKQKLQPAEEGPTLEPAAATTAPQPEPEEEEDRAPEKVDAEKVFASLGGAKKSRRDEEDEADEA